MPKKENIRDMFNDISPNYDKLNHIMSANVDKGWRKKAIKEIIPRNFAEKVFENNDGFQVIDIACGTGDFSFAIAKRMLKIAKKYTKKHSTKQAKLPENVHITGADISEGMLEVMKEKIFDKNMDGLVSAEIGDGEALRFEDNTFDRATIAMGIRNFEHVEKGLKEIRRVLKDDGKLVILELSVPENKVLRGLYKLYFLNILPKIGEFFSKNREAYEYLPDSVLKFPRGARFCKILSDCGYKNIRHKSLTSGICRMYVAEK